MFVAGAAIETVTAEPTYPLPEFVISNDWIVPAADTIAAVLTKSVDSISPPTAPIFKLENLLHN